MYTTIRIVAMQVFGLAFYLLFNRKGSPRHPPGTNVRCLIKPDPLVLTYVIAFQSLFLAFQGS